MTNPSGNAEGFCALMELIWNGGPAYDLHFPAGAARDANSMFAALFPEVANGVKHPEGEAESAGFWFLLPAGDQLFIQVDGGGCHFVAASEVESDD